MFKKMQTGFLSGLSRISFYLAGKISSNKPLLSKSKLNPWRGIEIWSFQVGHGAYPEDLG
jgi:hypothetical protein